MQSTHAHRFTVNRALLGRLGPLFGLAIGLGAWVLAGGAAVAQTPAPIASTLVATQEMSGVPIARRWVVRGEHAVNTEHVHAGGFVYVMRGASTLQMEGGEIALQENQGVWVPEGVPHTHKTDAGAQLWAFTLETEAEQQQAPVLFASKELTGYADGPHLARLVADQYSAGASTAPHRHYGPEAVFVRQGSYELSYAGSPQNYTAGQGYTVEPLVPHRLRNAGVDIARLFNLSMVPLGRQAGESLPADALR